MKRMKTMKVWQLIKNKPQLKERFILRSQLVNQIRKYFSSQGFLEVETPMMVKYPGTEPYLEVFETQLQLANQISQTAFLLTSPELAMKKLLAAGMGNIFQISKSFRNGEGISAMHNPEFTILEWYRTNADYQDIMTDCESLLLNLAFFKQKLTNPKAITQWQSQPVLSYQGQSYDISLPWERLSVAEAFIKYVGLKKIDDVLDRDKLFKQADSRHYQVDETTTWEQLFHQLLLNEIEPNLGRKKPTFLYDYPASQAALSKKKVDDPRFAERFEWYLGGIELGNAFSELTDWQEQRRRMLDDLQLRASLGKKKYELDKDFIEALKMGLPRTGGIAVGVDRLIMLLLDVKSVKETLLFPITEVFELE